MSHPTKALGTAFLFRSIRAIVAVVGFSALAAACSYEPTDQPRDVGNMAYPQPLPQGNLSTTLVEGRRPRDTGNMAYPEPLPEGVVGRAAASRQAFDTGNMSYPPPLPAGNGPVTRIR